ncbi:EI24 domain-containing protein [Janthinobacterium agaricidamnosum]|uniref:Putative membrane protein n=1 Tax=Janthinobacterium agaricidamnosum NBRC 102515 = DSM 9628 TaxID=1349767 RepID=W0VC87_9BURK|nr:EI24 domain-containing protein [Janthinobacterium agaricidamnosum]CDG84953.1 putative membrane protein [Janthinobacterium agaricidamnosum NBRC 102515 = DSM 9628]
MRAVLNAYGRALLSQLHGRILLLSLIPFLLSVVLWGGLLWWGLQPLVDSLQALFVEHEWFKISGSVLSSFGLGMLKTVIVPLIAMLVLLPLMILTALIFIGIAAMPAIARHVGGRHFPWLEKKRGGSLLGSFVTAIFAFLVFLLAWLLTLPLYAVPPLALAAHAVLWGWLTYRVVAYDALADYASDDERRAILRGRRWPLLAIGMISGAAGAAPGLLWMGGVMSVVLFPFLAALAIWLYVVIFIFTGLWFQYYCLDALAALRGVSSMMDVPAADA